MLVRPVGVCRLVWIYVLSNKCKRENEIQNPHLNLHLGEMPLSKKFIYICMYIKKITTNIHI